MSVTGNESADRPDLTRYRRPERAEAYAGKFEKTWGRRRTSRREHRILEDFLARFPKESSLLNVPCGAGRFSEILLAPGSGPRVFADASRSMLDEVHRKLGDRPDLRLEQVDLLNDEPRETFDVVVCIRLLHHLDRSEMARVLDYLCGAAKEGLILTVASDATWKGWRRARKARDGRRRGGETILSPAELSHELGHRGFRLDGLRHVDRLFSSQTWALARRST